MSLDHTPLDPAALGPEAQRALASPVSRLMAARGLAPISSPRDLVAVLYQLALDGDDKVRLAAQTSAGELPEGLARGGLADAGQDPRVLDFFAGKLAAADLVEVIVKNPATQPATIARIAATAGERLVEVITDNQERLLGHPDIIAALYLNRQARMSTIDRIVELAVRNGVKVAGIPVWDELTKLYNAPEAAPTADVAALDRAFERAAAAHADKPEPVEGEAEGAAAALPVVPEPEQKEVWALPVPMKIRLATLGNAFDRAILVRDPKKIVAIAAIKSPGVTEIEAAKYAGNTGLAEEVIGYIANKREWTKLYSIKTALVNNPKTPLPSAMRLLPLLREKDIQAVSRSRGIASALAAQARKLLTARSGKG